MKINGKASKLRTIEHSPKERCLTLPERNNAIMVFADDIRRIILKLAEERGSSKSFATWEVARAIDQKNWRLVMDQVTLVAGVLIREGKIIALTKAKSLRFKKNTKFP